MKKIYYLCVSLSLGFMVASCQNGLEEVINESEVQDELATTRAEQELTEMSDEEFEMLAATAIVLPITGEEMLGGTEQNTYSIDPIPHGTTSYTWSYDTTVLSCVSQNDNEITLQLANPSYGDDIRLMCTMRDSSNTVLGYAYKDIGINGPLKEYNTIHVYRASDFTEVYPHGNVLLQPNTVYRAYFYSSYAGNITNLSWNAPGTTLIDSYNNYYEFRTGSSGTTSMTVSGVCSPYTVSKKLVVEILYGE